VVLACHYRLGRPQSPVVTASRGGADSDQPEAPSDLRGVTAHDSEKGVEGGYCGNVDEARWPKATHACYLRLSRQVGRPIED